MVAQPLVVIVEDEPSQRHLLTELLTVRGFKAVGIEGGAALRALLARTTPSLVILDIGLRGEDGLSLARHLRLGLPEIGVIMVSAEGGTDMRVASLEAGADDYIQKPFEPRELLARIRSVLRRLAASATDTVPSQIRLGRHLLDLDRKLLVDDVGHTQPLAQSELNLLRMLTAHPHCPLTRDMLLDQTGQHDQTSFDRAIDVRIARLRRKIEADPAHPAIIRTVRGIGYMFVPESG